MRPYTFLLFQYNILFPILNPANYSSRYRAMEQIGRDDKSQGNNHTIRGCCWYSYSINHKTMKSKHRVPDNREERGPICCHGLEDCYPLGLCTHPDVLYGIICVAYAHKQLLQNGRKVSGRLWIISIQHKGKCIWQA